MIKPEGWARAALAAVLVAALGLSIAAPPAAAQAPRGQVRILVGFPPGGSADVVARLLAEKMRDGLGTTVIVDNRAGAAGRIAAEALKHAAPDGATIMLAPIAVTVMAPLTTRKLAFDPVADFAPVAHAVDFQLAFVASGALGVATLAEFVAWARANPAKASFGSPAGGSLPHFFGVMLGRAIGVDLLHVPYRGGAPMNNDLLGGQIPSTVNVLSEVVKLHEAGRVRVLASSGQRRSAIAPEVPTFTEQGFPGISGNGWFAFHAPARTPAQVVQALNRAIVGALADPDVAAKLRAQDLEPGGGSPEDLARLMAADSAKWRPIIEASGFSEDN